jgi:uncharacterized membrane protein SirB2
MSGLSYDQFQQQVWLTQRYTLTCIYIFMCMSKLKYQLELKSTENITSRFTKLEAHLILIVIK